MSQANLFELKLDEAKRQVEICNACRYCEGYCAVFPAAFAQRSFAEADLTQFANLCHNCRGCYYACQYSPPHEFNLNLPQALAEVRTESWQAFAFPGILGRLFHHRGLAVARLMSLAFALFFTAFTWLGSLGDGEGFYAVIGHGLLVALFMPAFLLPLAALGVSLARYWRHVGGTWSRPGHVAKALHAAATMRNLGGGQGQGCNYEDEDRYTSARRWAHQLTLYGFLLCFASTSSGTVLHYLFDWHAPYPWWSPPKLLGVPGGIILCIGTAWLAHLKVKADKHMGDARVWGGDMGFIALLFTVSLTGLLLYWLGSTPLLKLLLAIHLGAVLSFFILTPYSKMAHGFYRISALIRDAQRQAA